MAVAVVAVGVALTSNTLVWNNAFDVTDPNILCNIKVGDYRFVNAPVNVDVSLGLQRTIFSDDFESYAPGTFPSPEWTLAFNGNGNEYQEVVNNVSCSGNQSLQLMGNINWAADALAPFSSDSPVIGYEVCVRVDNSTGIAQNGGYNYDARVGFYKIIDWGHGAWYEDVFFTYDGSIVAGNDSASMLNGQFLQSYVPGNWYDVKVMVDRPNHVFSVWINGTLEGQNLQSSDDPYALQGFAVGSAYTQTVDNFDGVNVFEASTATNISISGTYSVELQYWNTTTLQWQDVQYLQPLTNITLTNGEYMQSYTFTPHLEGKYNVEVAFTYNSTADTFEG